MSSYYTYSLATSGLLGLQSLPLLISPRLIVSMLATEPRTSTNVETYLGRSLGIALVTLSALNLVLSGVLPVTSTLEGSPGENPYAYPTAVTTTLYHFLCAFYLYTQTIGGFTFGFGSGLLMSGALFCFGVFVCLFGNDKGRISKSTGADKRTSNFPLPNSESASAKKKEEKSKRKSISSKLR